MLLEHDWRIAPGEDPLDNDLDPNGYCPFSEGDAIHWVKGAEGPGNFVQALFANVTDPDNAYTSFTGLSTPSADQPSSRLADNSQVGDLPLDPQGSCISRVMYESEDPGEVDVEAFFDGSRSAAGKSLTARTRRSRSSSTT